MEVTLEPHAGRMDTAIMDARESIRHRLYFFLKPNTPLVRIGTAGKITIARRTAQILRNITEMRKEKNAFRRRIHKIRLEKMGNRAKGKGTAPVTLNGRNKLRLKAYPSFESPLNALTLMFFESTALPFEKNIGRIGY